MLSRFVDRSALPELPAGDGLFCWAADTRLDFAMPGRTRNRNRSRSDSSLHATRVLLSRLRAARRGARQECWGAPGERRPSTFLRSSPAAAKARAACAACVHVAVATDPLDLLTFAPVAVQGVART